MEHLLLTLLDYWVILMLPITLLICYLMVDWLCKFDKRITRANANRKTIKQLYWLYYNLPELINRKKEL